MIKWAILSEYGYKKKYIALINVKVKLIKRIQNHFFWANLFFFYKQHKFIDFPRHPDSFRIHLRSLHSTYFVRILQWGEILNSRLNRGNDLTCSRIANSFILHKFYHIKYNIVSVIS